MDVHNNATKWKLLDDLVKLLRVTEHYNKTCNKQIYDNLVEKLIINGTKFPNDTEKIECVAITQVLFDAGNTMFLNLKAKDYTEVLINGAELIGVFKMAKAHCFAYNF